MWQRGRNFFAEEGLDLKLVVMNARVSVLALLNGEIQFAVGASSINAALRGSPLKAIFFFYNTSTWQFMVRPEIRNAEDLKGKVVAIGTVGSTTDLATRLIVKKFGLEPGRDVKLLPTGDARARILTMETGQAVGSLLNPDVAAEMASKGYRILISSADVFPVPFSGIAANDQLIRTNPELIKRWMRRSPARHVVYSTESRTGRGGRFEGAQSRLGNCADGDQTDFARHQR